MTTEILGIVSAGQDLTMDQMADAIDAIMQGQWDEHQIGLLLMALRAKGETVPEIAGAAKAMRNSMTPIRSSRERLIDTCGTGGSGSGTFNISTAAALVTAAAGAPVAKHGNRRISSKTGSADVLAELGVNISADVETIEACLDELGICFCFAPLFHPSMKHVGAVRKKLGVPTIFNFLGPLVNPAGAPFQLLGVGRPELRPMLAEALLLLGTERALVVCADDGQDEISLSGATHISETKDGHVTEMSVMPEDFALARCSVDQLQAETPQESAQIIRKILAGEPGPARDVVVANAAVALVTVGNVASWTAGVELAREAIDSRAAEKLLGKLAERSNR